MRVVAINPFKTVHDVLIVMNLFSILLHFDVYIIDNNFASAFNMLCSFIQNFVKL